jgi:hypothetical protein
MTQKQRGELDARQQQQMARRGGQEAVSDQAGGLFSAERDQGDLLSAKPKTPAKSADKSRPRLSRTETPAFKKWFGESQVVAEDGSPLLVYRGLNDEFLDGINGAQFWTPDPQAASEYAAPMSGAEESATSNVVPAYLSIKNPYKLVDDKAARQLGAWLGHDWDHEAYYDLVMEPGIADALIERGYDGVELADSNGRIDHQTFVTFKPEQIKSATGNSGAFDPQDSRITFSRSNEKGGADADWIALRNRLSGEVTKLGLGDKVLVDVLDRIMGDQAIAGSYDRRIISIAMESGQNPDFTLDHEAIHALRDLGLFRSAEWTAITKAAQADEALMSDVRERYDGYGLTEEQLVEEAAADLFARWRAGRRTGGFLKMAFQRITDLFAAIRSLIARTGTAADVMRAVERGDVGSRSISEAPGDRRFSIPGPGQPEDAHNGVMASLRDGAMKLIGNGENMGERVDEWRTRLQDRMLPLLRTQQRVELQTGNALPEALNPYLSEELMAGKVGARLETLQDEHVEPLFDAMKAAKVSIDELETYLYARHAPERNARIAEINPTFEKGTGSGMTDAEAAEIMTAIKDSGKLDDLKALAGRVDKLLDTSIDIRVESGLLSKEEAEAWRSNYKNYVPLRGTAEPERREPGAPAARQRRQRQGQGKPPRLRSQESCVEYSRLLDPECGRGDRARRHQRSRPRLL